MCHKWHDKEEEDPMQLRYFFLTILLFLISVYFGFAQQSTVPEGTIVHLAEEPINDIAYSPDGELLAVASDSGIWLYDSVTHQEVKHLVEHTGLVNSISFSPDSTKLASADSNGDVYLWDVATGTLRHTLEGHTFDVNSISFRPDGRILASAGDRTVRLWSVITGEPLRTFHGHTGWVNSVSFNPDGKTLASAGSDGKILLWSVGCPAADINRDDKVNILDLVLVAGVIGENAAAPLALSRNLKTVVSRAEVQKWISDIQQLNLTDEMSQRGILFLEQLLAALTPKETALLPNYPNPFNPETWIPYQLAKPAEVTLKIYAMNGSMVRTLDLGHQPIGMYQTRSRAAHWDGRNAQGETVASGVYFYTLTVGEFSATRKLLIRK